MAAGDVNSRRTDSTGNIRLLTGTLEAANGTTVALMGTSSYIIACVVQNADDEEGARVQLNSNGSTTVNGSIHVTSAASDVDVWNYICFYV